MVVDMGGGADFTPEDITEEEICFLVSSINRRTLCLGGTSILMGRPAMPPSTSPSTYPSVGARKTGNETKQASGQRWIDAAFWDAEGRLLRLICIPSAVDHFQPPLAFNIFVPDDPRHPRFCFCDDDAPQTINPVVEKINSKLLPSSDKVLSSATEGLQQLSLLRDLHIIEQEVKLSNIWREAETSKSERLHAARQQALTLLKRSPDGSDLLLFLCYCAFASRRRHSVFQPFPHSLADGQENKQEAAYTKCEKVFAILPPVRNILLAADPSQGHRPESCTPLDEAALHFLIWLMRDVHTALIRDESSQYEGNPSRVYKIQGLQDPNFDRLARKYGKTFAYHGTSAENLHSILHNGLKNMSGTRYMKTGAAFGDGIYLAEDIKVSKLFAAPAKSCWEKSIFSPEYHVSSQDGVGYDWTFVLKCEVVKHPSSVLKSSSGKQGETYFVVGDERHVRLHSLLCYRHIANDRRAKGRRENGSLSPWLPNYLTPLSLLLIGAMLCAVMAFVINLKYDRAAPWRSMFLIGR